MSTTKTPIRAEYIYHLYNHANTGQNLFRNDENYRYFLKKYTFYMSDYFDTYSYCLMPNHFHFLIRVKNYNVDSSNDSELLESSELLRQYNKKVTNAIKNWIISYTRAYNKVYNTKGNLFIQKIRRKIVDNELYFKNLVNYIHLNPVYHNFVENPEDWKFSSYNAFLSGKKTNLCKESVLESFDDIDNFKYFHDLKKAEKFSVDMELMY